MVYIVYLAMARRSSVIHTLKLWYLWGDLANFYQILYMCEASLGGGKAAVSHGADWIKTKI